MNSDYYSCASSDESETSFYIVRKCRRESGGYEYHYGGRKSKPCDKAVELAKYREIEYEREKRERLREDEECINKLLIEINELEALYREISENPESRGIIASESSEGNESTTYFSCSNSDEMESCQLSKEKDNRYKHKCNPKYIVHLDPRKEDVKEVYCKLDEFLENKYLRKKIEELESILKATKTSSDKDVHD